MNVTEEPNLNQIRCILYKLISVSIWAEQCSATRRRFM